MTSTVTYTSDYSEQIAEYNKQKLMETIRRKIEEDNRVIGGKRAARDEFHYALGLCERHEARDPKFKCSGFIPSMLVEDIHNAVRDGINPDYMVKQIASLPGPESDLQVRLASIAILACSTEQIKKLIEENSQLYSQKPRIMELITTQLEIPPNWSEHKDSDTGKTYYFNKETNMSQWERPMLK